jgi:hypothetical protein
VNVDDDDDDWVALRSLLVHDRTNSYAYEFIRTRGMLELAEYVRRERIVFSPQFIREAQAGSRLSYMMFSPTEYAAFVIAVTKTMPHLAERWWWPLFCDRDAFMVCGTLHEWSFPRFR